MTHDTIDSLKRSAAIPSLPQVVTRFLEVIRDPAFELDEVAQVLAADPGMSADILRLANSALFGVTRRVSSLNQAIGLLGLRRVRSLVLGRYLIDSLGTGDSAEIDPNYFWRRSLATGVLAAKFVDARLPAVRDEAFMGGLLCDCGILILADSIDSYGPVARKYAPHEQVDFCELETAVVGVTHSKVSADVMDHWQLPELISESIRYHHHDNVPDEVPSDMATVAHAINAAGRIAKLLCETAEPQDVAATCREAMQLIELDVEILAQCLGEVEQEILELADVLHVDIIPSKVYSLLAEEIRKDVSAPAAV
jgi:HD-like signal output (HDOD) protein